MRYIHPSWVVAALILCTMSCQTSPDNTPAYIGPADLQITDGKMTPEVLLSLGRLSDPQLSPDGSRILFGVSYTSIPENRSCRNLFLCNPDGSGRQPLTRDGKSISCARWSPDGKQIFFVQGGQLWSAPVQGARLGKRRCRSDIPAGIGEFALSPDGSQVLFTSTVPSSVQSPADTDPALDKARAYVTEDLMYRHWDHWVTELPHSFVAPLGAAPFRMEDATDLLGGPQVRYELPIEPFGGIEQLAWSPDGKWIAYSCKKLGGKEYAFSTDTEIYLYEVASGKTTCIPMGGGYDTDPCWSPDGRQLAWLSMARNGYEADKTRLMVADIGSDGAASAIRDLTAAFPYNAESPVWSPDGQDLYFSALAEGIKGIFRARILPVTPPPTASPAARTDALPTAADIVRITADDLWYDFSSPFAILPDGTLLTAWCSMDFPTELVAIRPGEALPAGADRITAVTHENDAILGQLKAPRCQKRMVPTVDGKEMLTWVLLPPDFNPGMQYPAIEIFLGGPQGTLSQGWSYRWNYRLMASQGYVVVLPNRRGTTAFGQEWCEQISGDYIGLNMQDYLSAARMIKAEPYVGKLAGCGASYGGYSVYYMAGIHEDVFDCFIAHAGIFDEQYMYYETEEMWFPNWDNGGLEEYAYTPGQQGPAGDGVTFGGMRQGGSPWSDRPQARRHYSHSPAAAVTKWHTPILCIHGMKDYRIPYDQGMAAFNAAQMMGVPSQLIVFPEECHWILQPQNALFWHRSYFAWLDRWCKS